MSLNKVKNIPSLRYQAHIANATSLHHTKFTASAWGEENSIEVGKYIIHYEDGTSHVISLKYMDSLSDWWFMPEDIMPKNATQAWAGLNDLTEKLGYQISLFKYKWKNPIRDKTIKSIDYISTMTNAAPFLVSISLDE